MCKPCTIQLRERARFLSEQNKAGEMIQRPVSADPIALSNDYLNILYETYFSSFIIKYYLFIYYSINRELNTRKKNSQKNNNYQK